ncbi:MAG: hypothetical protein AAFV77_00625 [Planctomycetota bacterium]
MAENTKGTTAQAPAGNAEPDLLSVIQATVTGTIIQINNFTGDDGKPVTGVRVAYMGGNAYVQLTPQTIGDYGEGQEVTIGCGMIERRGDFRLSGKWKIIGKGKLA